MIPVTLIFMAAACAVLVFRTAELSTLAAALNVALAAVLGLVAGVLYALHAMRDVPGPRVTYDSRNQP